ncbi:hypothetical protein [Halovivax sp.]|uniref:hypothetical protein n=1 Tax=Halovivax sp. TaxID=1935978 RepID=UPI0025BB5A72|nr:hypothetical protein [Halovivax sp.]
MMRRTVLAATGVSAAGLVGCLDRIGAGGPPDTVTCTADFVPYVMLPVEVANEVDAAFADGAYETDGELYYDDAVERDAILWYAGHDERGYALGEGSEYYESRIATEDGTTVLSFEKAAPSLGSRVALILRNRTEETVDVAVSIAAVDEDRSLREESATVAADSTERVPISSELGDYDVTIDVDDRTARTETLPVTPAGGDTEVQIRNDDVSIWTGGWDRGEPLPCFDAGGWWPDDRGAAADM